MEPQTFNILNPNTIAVVISLVIVYVGKYLIGVLQKRKRQPALDEDKRADAVMHSNITDAVNNSILILSRIEKFLSIAANEYTRTLPSESTKCLVSRMFKLARHSIYSAIVELIEANVNWGDQHVRNKVFSQMEGLIENIYNNDNSYLRQFFHEGEPLSKYMDEEWKALVIETCKVFIENHHNHGNNYKNFDRNLRNNFEKFNYEFLNKM